MFKCAATTTCQLLPWRQLQQRRPPRTLVLNTLAHKHLQQVCSKTAVVGTVSRAAYCLYARQTLQDLWHRRFNIPGESTKADVLVNGALRAKAAVC